LVYQTEKTLREIGDKVPAADRSTIEQTIEDLKRAKDSDDTAQIKQLTEQLQQASYAIGQQMYAQQEAAQQAAGGYPDPEQPPHGDNAGDEQVVEGEFEEV